MPLYIFPCSPVWADFERKPVWAEEVNFYDSGVRQASTAWARPLHRYAINASNITEVKQSALNSLWHAVRGKVTPFLFKDPYDYIANGVVQSSGGMGAGSGFYLRESHGWAVIPDSGNFNLRDSRSGNLVAGVHYSSSLDNGYVTLLVSQSSTWVASFEFFRKVAFDDQYAEQSKVWNIFNTTLIIQELIPNA